MSYLLTFYIVFPPLSAYLIPCVGTFSIPATVPLLFSASRQETGKVPLLPKAEEERYRLISRLITRQHDGSQTWQHDAIRSPVMTMDKRRISLRLLWVAR